MDQNETALQKANLEKAHAAKAHLERIAKAVTSFNDTMTKLHKAHHDDMHKAIGALHKVLGTGPGTQGEVAPGGSEPEGVGTIPAGASTSTVEFGKTTMTPEEQVAAINKGVEDGLTKILEAILGKNKEDEECPNCGKPEEKCACTKAEVAKAAAAKALAGVTTTDEPVAKVAPGIGDRGKVAPVARVAAPGAVTKAFDQPGPAGTGTVADTTTTVSAETVMKAASGDLQAQLAVMKGSRPTELPVTLVEPMSKVH